MVDDDLGSRLGQMKQESVRFLRERTLGECRQYAGDLSVDVVQFVPREGNKAQFLCPLVIVYAGVRCNVVRQESLVFAGGNPADLIETQRHAPMVTVGMRIASRTGHQMEAMVVTSTSMTFVGHPGMDAARIAKIAGQQFPDTAEVKFEQVHRRVGNLLEFVRQWRGEDQFFLEPVDALQPPQGTSLPLPRKL